MKGGINLLLLISIIILIVLVVLYFGFYRPWQLKWGATIKEINEEMIGDEIVSNPTFNSTRAVTVNARPEHIYPWIIQMGHKRAGWYSYDWIDNLGKKSSEKIIPEYQYIEEGQIFPISPDGKQGFFVKSFDINHYVLLWDKEGGTTWLWKLNHVDDKHTRLITRVRIRYPWFSPMILFFLLLDVGDFFMMRKCMLGIKKRAEDLSQLTKDN